MNDRETLIAEAVRYYRKSLNPSSKFYDSDLLEFRHKVKSKKIEQLRKMVQNMQLLSGENQAHNAEVDSYIEELDKSGMFNIKPQQKRHEKK